MFIQQFQYFTLLPLDHYHALGVERNASAEAIERSHVRIVSLRTVVEIT